MMPSLDRHSRLLLFSVACVKGHFRQKAKKKNKKVVFFFFFFNFGSSFFEVFTRDETFFLTKYISVDCYVAVRYAALGSYYDWG